jgi:hypothetical protein
MCCSSLHFWKQQGDSVTTLAHSLKRQICRCLCVDYLAGSKIGSNLSNHLYIMLKQMTCWSSNSIIRDSIIIVYGGWRWSVHRHWHPCCYCCNWSCGCFYLVCYPNTAQGNIPHSLLWQKCSKLDILDKIVFLACISANKTPGAMLESS